MDASVLGAEGAEFGNECDAVCPDGTPLGSVEGTVAVLCDGITCADEIFAQSGYPTEVGEDTYCAFTSDLEAWQAEKCPGCVFWDWDSVRADWEAYPETCAHPYDYVQVRCDWSK